MMLGWYSTVKPTAVHLEDRADSPVLNRLDISSASVKTYIAVFVSLQGHEVPQNWRSTDKRRISPGVRLFFQNWCDTKPNSSQQNTQFWILITYPPHRRQVAREKKHKTYWADIQLMETYLFCQNQWWEQHDLLFHWSSDTVWCHQDNPAS